MTDKARQEPDLIDRLEGVMNAVEALREIADGIELERQLVAESVLLLRNITESADWERRPFPTSAAYPLHPERKFWEYMRDAQKFIRKFDELGLKPCDKKKTT